MMSQSWFRWHRLKTTSQRSSVPCILLAFLAPSQSQLSYSSQTLLGSLGSFYSISLPPPPEEIATPPTLPYPHPRVSIFAKHCTLKAHVRGIDFAPSHIGMGHSTGSSARCFRAAGTLTGW